MFLKVWHEKSKDTSTFLNPLKNGKDLVSIIEQIIELELTQKCEPNFFSVQTPYL